MTSTVSPPRRPGAVAVCPPAGRVRRQAPRRRRVLRVVAAIATLALLGTAVWVVYFSAVLDTRRVVVSGTVELTSDQVQQAARVPLRLPLARQNLDAVARRTTGLAPVAAARVTRRWPHTVQVSVTERKPLLGVPRAGAFSIVDAEGVAFATVPRLPPGVVRVEADVADRPLLVELGVVAVSLPPDLRRQVETIRAASGDGVVVSLRSGTTVIWGDADESALKAEVTATLLDRDPKRSIDVSSPRNPAVR